MCLVYPAWQSRTAPGQRWSCRSCNKTRAPEKWGNPRIPLSLSRMLLALHKLHPEILFLLECLMIYWPCCPTNRFPTRFISPSQSVVTCWRTAWRFAMLFPQRKKRLGGYWSVWRQRVYVTNPSASTCFRRTLLATVPANGEFSDDLSSSYQQI